MDDSQLKREYVGLRIEFDALKRSLNDISKRMIRIYEETEWRARSDPFECVYMSNGYTNREIDNMSSDEYLCKVHYPLKRRLEMVEVP